MNLTAVFVLLVVYQLKHFIADYPLQGTYMLGKFKPGWDFLGPLAAHCSVHAVFTACICLYYAPHLVWLAIVDFVCHFTMDRIKASPKYLGRYKALSGAEFMNLLKKFQFAQEGVAQAEQALSELPAVTVGGINPEQDSKIEFWVNNRNFHQQDVDICTKAFRSNVYFWWALGLDQMVHHLTHYGIMYILISNTI